MNFGSKYLQSAQKFGSKIAGDVRQFGSKNHILRKASNTMDKINSVALPALSMASAVAPELAPAFGTAGTVLKTGQTIANQLKKYD